MFENYYDYLIMIARMGFPEHLRTKLDPADVVQEALLKAHAVKGAFEGRTEAETLAFLQKIVTTTLADYVRYFDRTKRHATLERSLERVLDESSARLEDWLAAEQTSPSQKASQHEQLFRLAQALAELPESQRKALELHRLQGRSLAETAEEMAISKQAVAGLLRRGIQALRDRLRKDSA
jgi:RNA polymerase sigma-70 factor (ECF subfamily)